MKAFLTCVFIRIQDAAYWTERQRKVFYLMTLTVAMIVQQTIRAEITAILTKMTWRIA
jgi:hypothetical protein